MQLLCLLIFIGATQCDDSSDSKTLDPECYDNLGVPNAVEYISHYTISVQTAYLTSIECMLSSNHYIKSGFSEIDSSSNDLLTNLITAFKDGFGNIDNMINGLQQTDAEKESQEKISAVVSMTVNYYQKKEVTVEKSETKLSEVTEVQQAKSILTARRCESSYINFMNDVTTIKKKYTSETTSTDTIDANQWATQVKRYYDAREYIVSKTNVYASIREAFLFGSGINLCDASANTDKTDKSLLDIYKTDDLSKFFGKTDNDASALLSRTVTHMYSIYKDSLNKLYSKSVVHSHSDLAMRVTLWEQVNLVRANFDYMSQNIVLFIKTKQTDAESCFGANSEEYKKIMIELYISVNKMLLTVVKSTEVHYQRALNFNPDRSMIKTDFNQYKVDILEKYNEDIMWSNANAVQYDMRLIEQKDCSYPSSKICIPHDMYSLVINKLVFQTFICQVNYVYIRIKTTQYDKTNVDSWIIYNVKMIEFQNSILFSKYSATINKIYIINSATYTHILLTTDQSTQSNEVQQIMDQISSDVVGVLCVNTLEITETYNTLDVFVDTNCNKNTKPIVYKPDSPKTPPASGTPPTAGTPPTSGAPPTSGKPPTSGAPPTSGTPSTSGAPPKGNYPSNSGTPSTSGALPKGNYPSTSGTPPTSGAPPTSRTPSTSGAPPTGNYPSTSGTPPTGNQNSIDYKYSYIKSGTQVIKTVQLLKNSFKNKITSSLTYVQTTQDTQYTKVVLQSLKICKQISEYNTDYLDSVASDSIKYITEVTTLCSQEYFAALIVIFRDTKEKSNMLSTSMDIPFKRTTMYSLTSEEYVYVVQTVEYTEFVKNFYQYFEVNCKEIYNSENDANLFLINSVTQFNKIYEKVVTAIQQTPNDPYKTFILSYLEKTITVYKQTTDCFQEQIVQTKEFISQSGDNSKFAFYQEIMQRVNSITAMYSGILIKAYEYSKNTAKVTIYESEFDIITTQTKIVRSYTTTTVEEKTVEIEIGVSNN